MNLPLRWKLIGLVAAGTVVVGGGGAYWLATVPPHRAM